MNEFRVIATFVRAANLGSIRRAAIDLGVTPQAASQAIMQLEQHLGLQLFHRTTRKLSLTVDGERLLERSQAAYQTLNEALAGTREATDQVSGVLRVSGPRSMSNSSMWPLFGEFCQAYPGVRLELQLDDHFSNKVDERIDVGFRGGAAPEGRLVARQLFPIQHIICGAPDYLRQHGVPDSIEALAQHRRTGYRQPNTGKIAPWEFQIGDEIVYREIDADVYVNDSESEAQAVAAGLGIGQLSSFSATPLIRNGRLVPLLTQHITARMGMYLFYGPTRGQPLRVQAFVRFITERVQHNRLFYLDQADLQALRSN